MEGKQRAIQAYNISLLPRIFVEIFCQLSSFFKKRKILRRHYPYVETAKDPKSIIWENFRGTKLRNFGIFILQFISACILLFVTFVGMAYLARFEKFRLDYSTGDCLFMPTLTKT